MLNTLIAFQPGFTVFKTLPAVGCAVALPELRRECVLTSAGPTAPQSPGAANLACNRVHWSCRFSVLVATPPPAAAPLLTDLRHPGPTPEAASKTIEIGSAKHPRRHRNSRQTRERLIEEMKLPGLNGECGRRGRNKLKRPAGFPVGLKRLQELS
jgi:hypothetical protein